MDEDDLFAAIPAISEHERRALAVAEGWVGGDVAGVAIGRTAGDAPCVVVYSTSTDGSADVPSTVEGLPVQVVPTDPFSARSEPPTS